MNFVTRQQWGARPPTASTPLAGRNGFVIHWEGPHLGLTSQAQAQATVRQIQADHMEGRNSDRRPWNDIAYSFLADPFGYVYEGRGWDNRSAANGAAVANASWVAICYLGGEGDPFTDAAKAAILDLIGIGRAQHGFGADLFPHSRFFPTQCPGDTIRAWITNPSPAPAPKPPTVGAPFDIGDHMRKIPVHVPSLDDQGNGFVQIDASNDSVTGFVFHGSYPPADGYWPIPRFGSQDRGGKAIIEIVGGSPHQSIDFSVVVTG